MKIIVAGCGEMGLPMLRCLIAGGFDARGFDIKPADTYAGSGVPMVKVTELPDCDLLISVVRDEAQTRDLLFEQEAVFRGDAFPSILVVSSTLAPSCIDRLLTELPKAVELIDAPMSGASHAAEQGALTFMLGGPEALLDRLMPLFSVMGRQIFRGGECGAGMTLKVLNNYVTAASVVAVRRVLDAADSMGVDPSLLLQVMRHSSGANWFANQFDRITWSGQGYTAENTLGILAKDVGCALDAFGSVHKAGEASAGIDDAIGNAFDRALIELLHNINPLE